MAEEIVAYECNCLRLCVSSCVHAQTAVLVSMQYVYI